MNDYEAFYSPAWSDHYKKCLELRFYSLKELNGVYQNGKLINKVNFTMEDLNLNQWFKKEKKDFLKIP